MEFETGPAPFIRMSGLSLAFIPSSSSGSDLVKLPTSLLGDMEQSPYLSLTS